MKDPNELWKLVLNEMELQVSRPNFVTWLKHSQLVHFNEGVALVGLPNAFSKEWVQSKYHKLILGILRTNEDSIKNVSYVVQLANTPQMPVAARVAVETTLSPQLTFPELRIDQETNLNPRYTLESFVVGKTNELAYAAASAVIEDIGKKYNPLFIYGGAGLGKTHLIQAVGNEIKKRYQNRVRVRYVHSEKFTNEVVAGIKNKRMEDLKERYRTVDVLIIDDIQFIIGKEMTQEEFFHTFNALYETNKQIIISSDRPPRHLPTLEERLRSRFQGGMIADIGFPDYELRAAILKTKLQERNASLPDDIAQLIATKVQKNLRELEGVLNRILFLSQTKKQEVTLASVEHIINETISQPLKNANPNVVIKSVADFFEISIADLIGNSRRKEFVEPRQVAAYLLRDLLDLSYPYIGEKLGKRDHTTAIYACVKIEKELAKNQELTQKVLLIKDKIEQA
ncbi:MAG: chromosomal replication initiator protein DnaA [bacterium]|nr:chromosomal replication initiator protein DnaA [bacterium]